MSSASIVVDNNGTSLGYYDSGAPQGASQYTTIFAIHGVVFSSAIFQKIISISPASGIRFVAITRRNYPGSTAFSEAEAGVILGGTEKEKEAFIRARGLEIINFIDKFIESNSLPAISEDGRSGGVVILGWSLGNALSLAAVANLDILPEDAHNRVAPNLRAVIILEPVSVNIGLPPPEKFWAPLIDSSIPEEARLPMFAQWISSYFKHQDGFLQSRSLDALEYVIPATFRAPTIFNISPSEATTIMAPASAVLDAPSIFNFLPQLLANYRKAVYDPSIRKIAPSMKAWFMFGDSSAASGPATFWQVEDDDKAHGGGFVQGKVVRGANHFMHWDEPELTLNTFVDILRN